MMLRETTPKEPEGKEIFLSSREPMPLVFYQQRLKRLPKGDPAREILLQRALEDGVDISLLATGEPS